MTSKGTLAAALAFTAFLGAGPGAFSALHDEAGNRAAFAARYENAGVYLSVSGLGNKTLVVTTTPPSVVQCAQTLDVVGADAKFIDQVAAMGFDSVECLAYDDDLHIVSFEKRKISKYAVKPFKGTENRSSLRA